MYRSGDIDPEQITLQPNNVGGIINPRGIGLEDSVGFMIFTALVKTPLRDFSWKFGVFLSSKNRDLLWQTATDELGNNYRSLGWYWAKDSSWHTTNYMLCREVFSTPMPGGWTWQLSFSEMMDAPSGIGWCGSTSITFINPFDE